MLLQKYGYRMNKEKIDNNTKRIPNDTKSLNPFFDVIKSLNPNTTW